jgi:hypothetical protein
VTVKVTQPGKARLCWSKLDRKSKRLNFNFRLTDPVKSTDLAGEDTISDFYKDLKSVQT